MGDTHELTLPDGRRVTYADHGDPAGPVVLECVVTPQSRLLFPDQAELAWPEVYGWLIASGPTTSTSKPSVSAR